MTFKQGISPNQRMNTVRKKYCIYCCSCMILIVNTLVHPFDKVMRLVIRVSIMFCLPEYCKYNMYLKVNEVLLSAISPHNTSIKSSKQALFTQ